MYLLYLGKMELNSSCVKICKHEIWKRSECGFSRRCSIYIYIYGDHIKYFRFH